MKVDIERPEFLLKPSGESWFAEFAGFFPYIVKILTNEQSSRTK